MLNRWTVSQNWNEMDWALIVIQKINGFSSYSSKPFAEKTIPLNELIPIAIQQISCLEFIHSRGLLHRGVKPDNFVVSLDTNNQIKVYIIDFNRSKKYIKLDGNHIEYQSDNNLAKGNPLFHSHNYHNGIRRSRRDDMESLGLCWIYQLKGSLPWSQINPNNYIGCHSQYIRKVRQIVRETKIEDLLEGIYR